MTENIAALLKRSEELRKPALSSPWFVELCNAGDSCWCRTISNKAGSDDLEHCIASSGDLSKANADLIVHEINTAAAKDAIICKLLEALKDECFCVDADMKAIECYACTALSAADAIAAKVLE